MNRPVVAAPTVDLSPLAESAGQVGGNGAYRPLNRSVSTPFPMEVGSVPYFPLSPLTYGQRIPVHK